MKKKGTTKTVIYNINKLDIIAEELMLKEKIITVTFGTPTSFDYDIGKYISQKIGVRPESIDLTKVKLEQNYFLFLLKITLLYHLTSQWEKGIQKILWYWCLFSRKILLNSPWIRRPDTNYIDFRKGLYERGRFKKYHI